MSTHPSVINHSVTSFLAGCIAALCLPQAGVTNWMIDLTPFNAPIFLGMIGILYIQLNYIWGPFPTRLARHAYLWAFGYFLVGLWWIGNALLIDHNPYMWVWPLAVMGLPAVLAVFPGVVFGVMGYMFKSSPMIFSPLLFAALFTLADYARGHMFTGFSWNQPGMYWSNTLIVFQSVSVIGVYGLTFITIWVAAEVVDFYVSRKISTPLIILIGVIASILIFGGIKINQPPSAPSTPQNIVMVQTNIPQSERFDPSLMARHFERHLALSERPPLLTNHPTLIIWPETILPPSYINAPAVSRAVQETITPYPIGSVLLTGAVRVDDTGDRTKYYNSLIAFDQTGRPTTIYDKRHLVPFGEYIPYQKYIPLAPIAQFENITAGVGPTTVKIPGHAPFRPLICYESIFGGQVRNEINDTQWILVVTNDAWYGNSPGPHQHLAQARARAIETGRPVVRVAVTGISAVINPNGHIVTSMPYGTAGQAVATLNLPPSPAPTIYTQFGDSPLMICIAGIIALSIIHSRRRFYRQSAP